MTQSRKSDKSARDHHSQYEVVVRELEEKGLLVDPGIKQSPAPEDLNSRTLFPYEPSREPTIYSALNY